MSARFACSGKPYAPKHPPIIGACNAQISNTFQSLHNSQLFTSDVDKRHVTVLSPNSPYHTIEQLIRCQSEIPNPYDQIFNSVLEIGNLANDQLRFLDKLTPKISGFGVSPTSREK